MKKKDDGRRRKYPFTVVRQHYNGVRYRSRLEARWAVWFDAMDIPFVYEPEGVVLWGGQGVYLPDFWLPHHHGGIYAEVKPTAFTEDELKKCRMLCRMSGRPVLLLDGAPEPIVYQAYELSEKNVVDVGLVLHSKQTHNEHRFFIDEWNPNNRLTSEMPPVWQASNAYVASMGRFSENDK